MQISLSYFFHIFFSDLELSPRPSTVALITFTNNFHQAYGNQQTHSSHVGTVRGCLYPHHLVPCHRHTALQILLIWHSGLQWRDLHKTKQLSCVYRQNIGWNDAKGVRIIYGNVAEQWPHCGTMCFSLSGKITFKVMNESSLSGLGPGVDLQK